MKPNVHSNILLWTLFIDLVSFISSDCRRGTDQPCCYNEFQDPYTNLCKVCEPGRIGWNCQESCVAGYYGDLCRQPCVCSAKECDPKIGCPITAPTVRTTKDISTKIHGSQESTKRILSNDVSSQQQQFFSLLINTEKRLTYTSGQSKEWINKANTPSLSSDVSGTHHFSVLVTKPTIPYSSQHTRYFEERIIRKGRHELDLPISSMWSLLTLVVVALFLMVFGLVIIIILMAWYALKRTRAHTIPKGMKLLQNRNSMAYNQMRTTLDRGYTSLRRFEPRVTNGRRSGYMTTNSLVMAGTSTV